MVVAGKLGQAGHLDVWLNGTQVVNVDTAIGYYLDPTTIEYGYAYPHFGIYENNYFDPTIVYYANPEWGVTSLLDRVTNPLPVTVPPGGWV
jgi:hypothetical protein